MRTLTPAERRAFRAKAHALHPFVSIGQHGLTPAVLHEIDVNLLAHELIKIRVFNDDRSQREALLARVCEELDAAPVQHLGKILTIWRPAPAPEPEVVVPRTDRRKRTRAPKAAVAAAARKPAGSRAPAGRDVRRAPRRGPSVIQGGEVGARPPRGGAAARRQPQGGKAAPRQPQGGSAAQRRPQGSATAKRQPRGATVATGAKPPSRRPPRPHGKSASSSVGASGARRRRKAR